MKTFGIIWADGTKELKSILLNEDGNLRVEDSIRPYPHTNDWVKPQIVPLVKIEKPEEGEWNPRWSGLRVAWRGNGCRNDFRHLRRPACAGRNVS